MTNTALIESWVKYFNGRDVARCVGLYADDAVLHVAFAELVQGRQAIEGLFAAYFATAPLHCIVRHLYAGQGGRVVLEWEDKVGLLGVNIYDFIDGRIQQQRNYFDQISFLKLNGLPLPKE